MCRNADQVKLVGVLIILALWNARIGLCDPLPLAFPTPKLTVVPNAQVTSPSPDVAQADMGLVDPAATPHPQQTFTLKNTTLKPVTVSRLRASCGCETLLLSKAGVSVASAVLAPGEQAEVSMAVKIAGQHSGTLHKYAWVYGAQGDTPLATLEMAITLREAIAFTPDFLRFPSIADGTVQTMPLTVTADKSALPATGLPALVSSSSDILVTTQGSPQPTLRDGRPAIIQTYQVRLSAPPQSGSLAGDLHFTPSDAFVAFRSAVVPFVATVIGSLSAMPHSVFFGSISADQSPTRQVLINIGLKDQGQKLTVSSSIPWMQVTLAPASIADSPAQRLMTITLKPSASTGPVQTQVLVTSASGERLAVPVIGEIIRQSLPK